MAFARPLTGLALLTLAFTARAQQPTPERLPYTFSNFVWWTDAELRHELARHKLPPEIARNSRDEQEIRKRLSKLLHKQHLHADVQSIEPAEGSVRVVGSEPPAIVFRVVAPPEIDVESVSLAAGVPTSVSPEVKELNRTLTGHAYAAESFPGREHRLAAILADDGYLQATATLQPGAPHAAADGHVLVPLTVTAIPGAQFHVAEVTADGGPLLEGRNLSRYIGLHAGDVANTHGFARLEASLRQLYQGKGYADVRFADEPTIDAPHALATYHFRVLPGPQFHIDKVQINGLSPAQSGEARETLGLKPGDLFNQRALGELYRKIKSSPTLLHETFSYTVRRDPAKSTVELTLDFSREH